MSHPVASTKAANDKRRSPIPTLRSICVAMLPQMYGFSRKERHWISRTVQPSPSQATLRHFLALRDIFGGSKLDYGLAVKSHEVLQEFDNRVSTGGGQTSAAIEVYKARTIYGLPPPPYDSWRPKYESTEFDYIGEEFTVEIEWSRSCKVTHLDSIHFFIWVHSKTMSFKWSDEEVLELGPDRGGREQPLSPYDIYEFFDSLYCVLAVLTGYNQVTYLHELLPPVDIKLLLNKRNAICYEAPDTSTLEDYEKWGADFVQRKMDVLLLMTVFMGEKKDEYLTRHWLSDTEVKIQPSWIWVEPLLGD